MKKYIPLVIAFALFMENLDATIISTAIPKIAADFAIHPINLKVALTSYLLSLAVFIPISGWIADKYGTQRVFTTALGVFTLGSLFCSLSTNLSELVIARVIQGIGGALMMPVGRVVLLKTYPKSELVKVMNYVALPALIGPALGPVLAGVIVSHFSWRWIFIVNIPFGLLGMLFSWKLLANYYHKQQHPLDYWGFLLLGIGLASFSFALQTVNEGVISHFLLMMIFMLSLVLLGAYFIRSYFIKYPFIDLGLFKARTFKITVLGSFCSRCGIGGMPFILPLFFQLSLGKTPFHSGILLLPYALAMIIMKFLVKQNLKRFGFKRLLLVNTFLLGLSMASFTLINLNSSIYFLITLLFINGLLASSQFTCMNVLSFVDLDEEFVSKGSSFASAAQQLSMSFGIAIAAMTLKFFVGSEPNDTMIDSHFFHDTFMVLGFITLCSTLVFTRLKSSDGEIVSQHKSSQILD